MTTPKNPETVSAIEQEAMNQLLNTLPNGFDQQTLEKMATPTPANTYRTVQPKPQVIAPFEHTDEPIANNDDIHQIMEVTGVDPLTAQKLSRIPESDTRKVGSFIQHGDVFVFVDCLNLLEADSVETKHLAYNYRYAISMADAGIEVISSPAVLNKDDKPACLFGDIKATVYRVIFRLQRSV